MLNYYIRAGQTDVSVTIRIVDSTDGSPETGVTSATAGLALEYRRELAVSTAITESDLAALTTAHTDGGMRHIGNGYYRLDLPDAACATGVAGCLVHGTATGMVVIGCYVHLNLENAADIADAVLDEATSGHTTAGTLGVKINGMTFTTANMLDVAVKRVGDTTLTQSGTGSQRYGG